VTVRSETRPTAGGRAGFALAVIALLALAAARGADAQVVHGAFTLHELVAGAEWVLRGQIEAHSDLLVLDEDGVRRPVVEARVLEVLKAPPVEPAPSPDGQAEAPAAPDAASRPGDKPPASAEDDSPRPGGSVRFAQHGHGVAEYEVGEEAIVFLLPLARSPELARHAGGTLRFVSLQEHDAKLVLTETSRAALVSAVRAAGARPSPPVTAELARLVVGEDAAAAEVAAAALGAPGHGAALPALAEALRSGTPRLRLAAVRGLGGIGSAEARAVLAEAAAGHPDAATRRRAEAELRVLGGRSAAGGNPGAAPAAEPGPDS
jgi:hypothetical protein